MKKATLTRGSHLSQATIGVLEIRLTTQTFAGSEKLHPIEHAPIFTLENPSRPGIIDDRIPAGTYQCVPYSGTKYKNVYLVKDVPGRSAILLHWGNTEKDTEGCILLGNRVGELNGQPAVLDSKKCFARFRELIGSEAFVLEVVD